MISAIADLASHSAPREFTQDAFALLRAVHSEPEEDTLIRDCMSLFTCRFSGYPWAAHVREADDGWRLVGSGGISDPDLAVLNQSASAPTPIAETTSWSRWTPIEVFGAPWPELSAPLRSRAVVMPSTFMDGELAGAITVFAPLTPTLRSALEDAATLLWGIRARGRHHLLVSAHTGQYTALAEFSPDVIWRLDIDHRLVYVNRAFDRDSRTREARVGMHVLDCIPTTLRDAFRSALRLVDHPEGRAEFVCRVAQRHFAVRVAPELDALDRIVGVVVTIRDVTEPYRLEQERQALLARCEVISQVARSVIYERRLSDGSMYVSPSIQQVFGFSARDAEQGGLEWWLQRIHPDDRERCAELFATRTDHPDNQWAHEFRVKRSDGTYATVLDHGRMLPQTDYAGARTVGAVTDVTAIRAMQAQLNHSHRVELIGRLAGGVAHDFNNVLAAIGGFTELLQHSTPDSDPRARDLNEIATLVQRASALTQNLLGLSRRREHAKPVIVDVGAAIGQLRPTLRTLLGAGVTFTLLPIEPSLGVLIDPGHLDQILLNLVVNARDAMPDGGAVTIQVRREEFVDSDRVRPGIRIDVSDRGLGIPPDVMAKVFQPYFTTKPEGHGTGLGLSVVHELVTTSGGSIDAKSVPSLGTTFTVRFPIAEGRITPVSHPVIVDPRDAGSHTVLLIDDEEAVRRSTRRILERTGYTVLEARTGDEGIKLLAAHRSSIEAIITDLYMPGLSGPALIERMRAEAPEIGCLVISGHAERFSRLRPEEAALIVQQKPCQAAVLIGHVATLIEGSVARRTS